MVFDVAVNRVTWFSTACNFISLEEAPLIPWICEMAVETSTILVLSALWFALVNWAWVLHVLVLCTSVTIWADSVPIALLLATWQSAPTTLFLIVLLKVRSLNKFSWLDRVAVGNRSNLTTSQLHNVIWRASIIRISSHQWVFQNTLSSFFVDLVHLSVELHVKLLRDIDNLSEYRIVKVLIDSGIGGFATVFLPSIQVLELKVLDRKSSSCSASWNLTTNKLLE